jgi:hypothetical protein
VSAGDRTEGVGDGEQHQSEGECDPEYPGTGASAVNADHRADAEDGCADGEEYEQERADELGYQFAPSE